MPFPLATKRAGIPLHLLTPAVSAHQIRLASTQRHQTRLFTTGRSLLSQDSKDDECGTSPKLTHVSPSGSAHMVSIAEKQPTARTARAVCSVRFSSATAATLVRENALKKGDVLGVARVAGIMAAKRTPDLIPLCHPIAISKVAVDLTVVSQEEEGDSRGERVGGDGAATRTGDGRGSWRVDIEATVSCEGKTGVEMEALTAASTAALTVYDMCKAVDKGMIIEGLRVVLKEGGKSGRWVEGERDR